MKKVLLGLVFWSASITLFYLPDDYGLEYTYGKDRGEDTSWFCWLTEMSRIKIWPFELKFLEEELNGLQSYS